MTFNRASLCAALFLCASALADESAGPAYVPYQPSGIYALIRAQNAGCDESS